MYALVSMESDRYGTIVSRHRTLEAAKRRADRQGQTVPTRVILLPHRHRRSVVSRRTMRLGEVGDLVSPVMRVGGQPVGGWGWFGPFQITLTK